MVARIHRSGVRRPEIIRAARAIVVEAGPEACGTAAIARAVGVTGAALYRHFSSKDEIVAGVVVDVLEDLASALRLASAGRHGVDAVVWSSVAFARYAQERPGEFRLLDHLVGAPFEVLPGDAAAPVLAATMALLAQVAAPLAEAERAGALSVGSATLRASGLWVALTGALRLGKIERRVAGSADVQVSALARELSGALLAGWGADRAAADAAWEAALGAC